MVEKNRGEALAERLRAHGLVTKRWWEMGAAEQLAIAAAAAEYDDELGNVDLSGELEEAKEEVADLVREAEAAKERREAEGISVVEDPKGNVDVFFRGRQVEEVAAGKFEWGGERDEPVLTLRLLPIEGKHPRLAQRRAERESLLVDLQDHDAKVSIEWPAAEPEE